MKLSLLVLRKPQHWESLQAIEDDITQDNPAAAAAIGIRFIIDDQVSKLADPNLPRRPGRVPGALELVAHPSYVVILEQTLDLVTVLEVLHTAMRYP